LAEIGEGSLDLLVPPALCHFPVGEAGGKLEITESHGFHGMESEREKLRPFRLALSKEDQEAFDRLFDRAKMQASTGVYMSSPWPMETILLSILLEQGKMIEEILGLLKEKEKKG
jgi:hypothetical protein